jgi:hypothetical protein
MSVPGTGKARPAPAVNGAGLGGDADGSQAVGNRGPDRHLQRPDRPPGSRRPPRGRRTPEPRSFRWVPVPLPVPAGPSCDFRRNLWGGLG